MSLDELSDDVEELDGADWQRIAQLEPVKTVTFRGISHRVSVLNQYIGDKSLITFMATPLPPSLDVHQICFNLFDGNIMPGVGQSPLREGFLDISYLKAFLQGYQLLD